MAGRLRILATIADRRALPLLELTLARADEIDVDLDVLANQTLAQKFPCFLRIEGLLRVRQPT